jgi:hypothetical protein
MGVNHLGSIIIAIALATYLCAIYMNVLIFFLSRIRKKIKFFVIDRMLEHIGGPYSLGLQLREIELMKPEETAPTKLMFTIIMPILAAQNIWELCRKVIFCFRTKADEDAEEEVDAQGSNDETNDEQGITGSVNTDSAEILEVGAHLSDGSVRVDSESNDSRINGDNRGANESEAQSGSRLKSLFGINFGTWKHEKSESRNNSEV